MVFPTKPDGNPSLSGDNYVHLNGNGGVNKYLIDVAQYWGILQLQVQQ